MHKIAQVILFVILLLVACSCGRNYTPEQKVYIAGIEKERKAKDISFKNDEESPFNHKSKIHFEPIKYYDFDPSFVFQSKLNQFPVKDTIKVFGTKGEERKAIRFGYVTFKYDNKDYKVNVYKGSTRSGQIYYSIWFTDKTTGDEPYNGARDEGLG